MKIFSLKKIKYDYQGDIWLGGVEVTAVMLYADAGDIAQGLHTH